MSMTWQLVAVLAVILACATVLAALGLVSPAVATGAIGTVLGWLIPAPRLSAQTRKDDPPAPPPDTVTK